MSKPGPGLVNRNETHAGAIEVFASQGGRGTAKQQSQSTTSQSSTAAMTEAPGKDTRQASSSPKTYKGFVAGVFSGIAKLSVGHPFDTVKVRLQTSTKAHFSGPWDCVRQTVQKEGFKGLYKGATPPLVGWMFMDSLMLGSLTFYRRMLLEKVWSPPMKSGSGSGKGSPLSPAVLPSYGHGIAGILAGCTVSMIAAPVEHVKARLQIQYAARKSERLYAGPLDCVRKIYGAHGVRGLYHGLGATMLFRSFFFFWWASYDVFSRALTAHTALSAPVVNFWAGGLSAQVFWLTSYPSDVVKQRIMTDPLGPGSGSGLGSGSGKPRFNDGTRKYARWIDAARDVYRRDGVRGYWRGFLPCFLRAFPANAMALVAFEGVMRSLPE